MCSVHGPMCSECSLGGSKLRLAPTMWTVGFRACALGRYPGSSLMGGAVKQVMGCIFSSMFSDGA